MRNTPFLFASVAALAVAACSPAADDTTIDTDTTETTAMADEMAPEPAPAEVAPGPQGFVDQAAASDMYEVEAAKLAQQMGSAQAVKDFGAMMERDHTKSTADLKTAAGQVDGVTVAPQMTAKQQSDLAALRDAGANFDSVYKQQQVAAHEAALRLMQTQAETGEAAPLKAFASKTAPVIEGHLGMARDLP